MFSLGGKVDPSLKASLNQAAAEAEAAGLRIQSSLRKQLSGVDKRLSKIDPMYSDYEPLMQKKASLERSLLMVQNAKYVSAARERMSALQAERSAESAAELARYHASASQSAQVANTRAGLEAETAAMLRNREALKALIAEKRTAAAEMARYNASSSQTTGFANPRAGLAGENAAWAAKLAEFRRAKAAGLPSEMALHNAINMGVALPGGKPQSVGDWKSRLAALRSAPGVMSQISQEAGKSAGNIEKMAHGAGGLNLMIRETLVVFREIGRGNWSRVPGSVSLIVQGFAQLKQISMLTLGAWGLAIGGIVGSVFIYLHRIKSLAADLSTTIASAFRPEHVASYQGKLEIINQLHKDVADSARQISEAHDAVSDSIQRELEMTRTRIGFERELLEAQKANALAAVKNPAEREAIEKKFSALIMANKKKERDAQVKSMQEEVKRLPAEITKAEEEIKRLQGGDFVGSARDAQILKQRQSAADAAEEYLKQFGPGEKDERTQSADADRKRLARFNRNKNEFERLWKSGNPTAALFFQPTEEETAKAGAAKERLANADSDRKSLNEWINATDNRDRQRQRVGELEKRVKDDNERLAKLGPRGGGAIADTIRANLEKDKQDLALEQERQKRVDAGKPLGGREVTERERVGFGSPQIALLDVNRSMDRKLGILVQHAQQRGVGNPAGLGLTPTGFGD